MPRLTFPERRNLVLTIHFTFKISLTLSHESNKCRLLSKHIHVHHILLTFWLGLYLVDRNIFWGEISHGKMKGHTCLFQKDLFLCPELYLKYKNNLSKKQRNFRNPNASVFQDFRPRLLSLYVLYGLTFLLL